MAAEREPATTDRTTHAADVALVRSVQRNDLGSLREFTVRMQCVPRFLSLHDRRFEAGLRREELEDLAQDVLTAVWRRLSDYRGDASLETWVYRFCELQLRNASRRAAVRRAASLDDLPERESPLVHDQAASCRLEAAEALSLLGPEDTRIVWLKHYESLTFDQVAERLATSPNTIKTRYYRALDMLSRLLDTNRGDA